MVRLAGVDIPLNKRLIIALTYIQGIGPTRAAALLTDLDLDFNMKARDLSESDIVRIRKYLESCQVEGDLRRQVSQDIKRLYEIGCYRGNRHRRRLPVRGQRTHTNARTRRGRAIAVAGKKKVTK